MQGKQAGNPIAKLITIASLLGGHPGARSAKHAPVVIPSWRDMDPDSPFIRQLHRRPLPSGLDYHHFTLGLAERDSLIEANDGMVPLSSQLVADAQREARERIGVHATHVVVLSDPVAIDRIKSVVYEARSVFPDDNLRELL